MRKEKKTFTNDDANKCRRYLTRAAAFVARRAPSSLLYNGRAAGPARRRQVYKKGT